MYKRQDFELPDQNGEMHKLSDYAGKKVILYFYPKDNTPAVSYTHLDFIKKGDDANTAWEKASGSSAALTLSLALMIIPCSSIRYVVLTLSLIHI